MDTELCAEIEKRLFRSVPPSISVLTTELVERYGSATQAVIFYGSCLQAGDPFAGIVDLYILVDSYRRAYGANIPALANRILPPNVYYHETRFEGRTIRTKYAVLSVKQFRRGCSMKWFHSYFWARFCQPSAVTFLAGDNIRNFIVHGMATSVTTFLKRTVPCICTDQAGWLTWEEIWFRGLMMSYSAELRPERPERIRRILRADSAWFKAVTGPGLQALGNNVSVANSGNAWQIKSPPIACWKCRAAWLVRKIQGKLLSVLRLAKASFTFSGGVDYIVWKIERHSGVKIEVTPFLRRHPIIAMAVLSWRILRLGGVR